MREPMSAERLAEIRALLFKDAPLSETSRADLWNAARELFLERHRHAAQVAELLRRGPQILKIGDRCTVCHEPTSLCECFGRRDYNAR